MRLLNRQDDDLLPDLPQHPVKSWFGNTHINTLTVLIMQVPCCMGLVHLAKQVLERSKRKVPLKAVVVGLRGEILSEDWI